jgi:ketosteroid isomerase-like protein
MTLSADSVRKIYDDFAQARFDRLSEILDEDVDFLSHAPSDIFPYLGRRRGRADVLESLLAVHQKLEILSFWPMTTVVENDQAALTVVIKVKDRVTERTANFLGAHFLRFRDGRIVNYCAIIDSLDAVRQMADLSVAMSD